ncbi:MAG: ZIP family metal transporter [Promethearchaeota archaeon]
MLIWIIVFSILGSIGAILGASAFVFFGGKYQETLITMLIAFATGVLLSAAFLGLIPEALESVEEPYLIMPYILGGILFFFLMEKIIIWRNCRNKTCQVHSHASGSLILLGDAFHNLTDGVVITAAFILEFHLGIITGVTIIFHELAQETGDFGVLLHSGYSKKKAFTYNIISSSVTIPSAIISYFILEIFESIVPFLLAISAASFIYIALSDLTPDLHQHFGLKYTIRQFLLITAGIIIMFILLRIGGHNH